MPASIYPPEMTLGEARARNLELNNFWQQWRSRQTSDKGQGLTSSDRFGVDTRLRSGSHRGDLDRRYANGDVDFMALSRKYILP